MGHRYYENCEKQIIAAAIKLGGAHCVPASPPSSHGAAACASLSIYDGAVWDVMSWLHSIAHGHDGALRWAMAEKPWVIGAQQNTWVGDYTGNSAAAEKAFDMYPTTRIPLLHAQLPDTAELDVHDFD